MKKRLLILTLASSMIFASACGTTTSQKSKQPVGGVESSLSQMGNIQRIKVTDSNACVRSGCSNTTPILHTPGKDNTLDVVSKVEDWFAVKLPDNTVGFIPSGQCKPVVVDGQKPQAPTDTGGAPQGTSTPQGTAASKTQTANNTTALTTSEQKMIKLVNDARAQNNLPPLQVDMQLTNVARIKAQDMIDNNYFSHNSPKYGSPFDMMKAFGISFVQAGENIAGNQTVENAENALMNSPGHRQNILNPNYTHIGIGIKAGGPYGNMFSQMFISKPR